MRSTDGLRSYHQKNERERGRLTRPSFENEVQASDAFSRKAISLRSPAFSSAYFAISWNSGGVLPNTRATWRSGADRRCICGAGRYHELNSIAALGTAKALAVLQSLLWGFHNAGTGRCFPSYEAIAERAGCVAEAIRALERAGVLTWCNRLKRVRELMPGLFGKASAWRWRVIRTSNAYAFADPASKSDFPTQTTAQVSTEERIASGVPPAIRPKGSWRPYGCGARQRSANDEKPLYGLPDGLPGPAARHCTAPLRRSLRITGTKRCLGPRNLFRCCGPQLGHDAQSPRPTASEQPSKIFPRQRFGKHGVRIVAAMRCSDTQRGTGCLTAWRKRRRPAA